MVIGCNAAVCLKINMSHAIDESRDFIKWYQLADRSCIPCLRRSRRTRVSRGGQVRAPKAQDYRGHEFRVRVAPGDFVFGTSH